MDYTYIIKTKTDITQPMLDVCVQSSVSNLRTSVDGLLAVLKWNGANPPMFSGDVKYTHAQIIAEIDKPEWNDPM